MSQVPAFILHADTVATIRRRKKPTAAKPAAAPLSADPRVAALQKQLRIMGANSAIRDQWISRLVAQVRSRGRAPLAIPGSYIKPRAAQGTGAARQIDALKAARDAGVHNAQVKQRWIASLVGQVRSLGLPPAPQPAAFAKP